jgi:predicted RND superfamily exporter protein
MIENKSTKWILLAVLILIVFFSSFYILDFKAANSNTQDHSVVSAYSTGDLHANFSGRIYLYVEGEDSIANLVRDSLKAELNKAGMEVSIVDGVKEKYDSQALLVNVSEQKGLYTPFYASSDLSILLFYTSTGEDTKYFEQFKEKNVTVVFTNSSSLEGEKLVRGDIELQDSTKGLVSLKAYKKHLASEAAKEIAGKLEQNIRPLP